MAFLAFMAGAAAAGAAAFLAAFIAFMACWVNKQCPPVWALRKIHFVVKMLDAIHWQKC